MAASVLHFSQLFLVPWVGNLSVWRHNLFFLRGIRKILIPVLFFGTFYNSHKPVPFVEASTPCVTIYRVVARNTCQVQKVRKSII